MTSSHVKGLVGTCLGTCCSAQMECRCDDGYENRTGECVLTDVCVNNNGGCHPRVCTCNTVLPSEHARKSGRHTVNFRPDARQLHRSKQTARVQQKLSVTAGTSAPVTSCMNSNTHLLCRRFIGCCRCLVSRDLPAHPQSLFTIFAVLYLERDVSAGSSHIAREVHAVRAK